MDLTEIPAAESFARHPWEVVRAQFFADVLRLVSSRGATSLLDAGAGDGWFASRLAAEHPERRVTCFDPGYERGVGEVFAQSERVDYVATRPAGPFDVVTLLDVLEHVPDDTTLLADLTGVLRPGGHLLISVPAWPALFSRHDVALNHERRYIPSQLLQLLQSSGLTVLRRGGLFHSLLLARALSVAMERRPSSQHAGKSHARHELEWHGGRLSRRLVQSVLSADTRFSELAAAAGLQVPGLSWWALCQRPL